MSTKPKETSSQCVRERPQWRQLLSTVQKHHYQWRQLCHPIWGIQQCLGILLLSQPVGWRWYMVSRVRGGCPWNTQVSPKCTYCRWEMLARYNQNTYTLTRLLWKTLNIWQSVSSILRESNRDVLYRHICIMHQIHNIHANSSCNGPKWKQLKCLPQYNVLLVGYLHSKEKEQIKSNCFIKHGHISHTERKA